MCREPNSYSENITNPNRLLTYQKADACSTWSASRWMQVNMLMIPQIVYTANDVYSVSDAATSVIVLVHQYYLYSIYSHQLYSCLINSHVTHKALYVLPPPCTNSNVIATNGLTEVPTQLENPPSDAIQKYNSFPGCHDCND